ncbi:Alpha/Beta hydrolase protein [Apodospora peruviana]|uniref:Alpha/Beta hydrolase protein n=1 Tax=Apodospora peruviana TaxID=516989 RepID=A0AAE0HXA1_9PEZI|nr:Alpha/Beta hydrolase protein [Apodospora peruviana]
MLTTTLTHKPGKRLFTHRVLSISLDDYDKVTTSIATLQTEHLHDAVTWFLKHPIVEETKLALYGLCFGGNVPLAATALDPSKRIVAMIAVAPLVDSTGLPEPRQPILELAMHDGAAQLANEQSDPMYRHWFDLCQLENTDAAFWLSTSPPTPGLMVTPELDVSCPAEDQLRAYDRMRQPKELHVLLGKGHLDWIFEDVDSILGRQLELLKRHMDF